MTTTMPTAFDTTTDAAQDAMPSPAKGWMAPFKGTRGDSPINLALDAFMWSLIASAVEATDVTQQDRLMRQASMAQGFLAVVPPAMTVDDWCEGAAVIVDAIDRGMGSEDYIETRAFMAGACRFMLDLDDAGVKALAQHEDTSYLCATTISTWAAMAASAVSASVPWFVRFLATQTRDMAAWLAAMEVPAEFTAERNRRANQHESTIDATGAMVRAHYPDARLVLTDGDIAWDAASAAVTTIEPLTMRGRQYLVACGATGEAGDATRYGVGVTGVGPVSTVRAMRELRRDDPRAFAALLAVVERLGREPSDDDDDAPDSVDPNEIALAE